MNFCGTSTPAGKRYQRRVIVTMVVYMVVLFGAISVVKHTHPHGWLLYAISVLPAVPILAMMGALGVYLQEEKDEYLRLITMRSLLVGSAALLAVLVVNDFLRSISGAAALPEFTSWVLFFVVFGLAQAVQTMRNRVKDDA
jgi:RsiW-degrading membrane proteinase PrsW (M82 family)